MVKLEGVEKIFAQMYTDVATIYSTEETSRGTFVTKAVSDTPRLKDIPCRLSFNFKDSPKDVTLQTHEEVSITGTLHCSNGVEIFEGDVIEIVRKYSTGETYQTLRGKAGRTVRWNNHSETAVLFKELN